VRRCLVWAAPGPPGRDQSPAAGAGPGGAEEAASAGARRRLRDGDRGWRQVGQVATGFAGACSTMSSHALIPNLVGKI
jgi:hypothetical protein